MERSQLYYLDVIYLLANKGGVVTMLSRRLDIPLEQIVTIGNILNDVFMFRKSGFSIAMGNPSDDVKRQAWIENDSTEHEGFAKASD